MQPCCGADVLHAYMSRIVFTFWWTTATCSWLTNYLNAIILLILAWTIKWLIDFQMGGGAVRVFALIKTSARWPARSHMYAPTPASLLFGSAPLAFRQHMCRYTACRINDQQTCGKKTHLKETQSMFRKYNWSWRVRGSAHKSRFKL